MENNPWSQVSQEQATNDAFQGYNQSANYAMNNLPDMMQNNQQMQYDYARASKEMYPTFPNSFGIGSQQAIPQEAPKQQQQNVNNTLRGTSPWSLTGEALSR